MSDHQKPVGDSAHPTEKRSARDAIKITVNSQNFEIAISAPQPEPWPDASQDHRERTKRPEDCPCQAADDAWRKSRTARLLGWFRKHKKALTTAGGVIAGLGSMAQCTNEALSGAPLIDLSSNTTYIYGAPPPNTGAEWPQHSASENDPARGPTRQGWGSPHGARQEIAFGPETPVILQERVERLAEVMAGLSEAARNLRDLDHSGLSAIASNSPQFLGTAATLGVGVAALWGGDAAFKVIQSIDTRLIPPRQSSPTSQSSKDAQSTSNDAGNGARHDKFDDEDVLGGSGSAGPMLG